MMLHEYKGKWPKLGERVYVAEGAQIVGDVEIGDHSSVWYNCVVRGDVNYIRIGRHTNLQDGTIGHVMKDEYPLIPEGTVIPPHSLVIGMPAKVKRQLSDEEVAGIDEYARRYYAYKETYLNG